MTWPERDDWPIWMFRGTPHEAEVGMGIFLLAIAIVYAVYGVSTARLSWSKRPRHARCNVLCTYFFWFGLSLFGEATLYSVLAVTISRGAGHALEFWVLMFFAVVGTPALVAFGFWLRDR